jgi:hypothetical protein
MRNERLTRRLAFAFLAMVVLWVSLASAAHSHGAFSPRAAVSAGAERDALRGEIDLACALCAAAARLGHGARTAPLLALPIAAPRLHPPCEGAVAPQRVARSRSETRAPPRLG